MPRARKPPLQLVALEESSDEELEVPPVVVGQPIVFAQPAPDAVVEPDPPRHPAKKQKVDRRRRENRPERETMPPEYVKGPGKPGKLHPHWRKSFPDDEEEDSDRGKVVQVPDALRLYGEWRRVPGFWKILASDQGFITTEGNRCVRKPTALLTHYLIVICNGKNEYVHLLVARAFHGRPTPEQTSVDHKDRDELNNCETNLRWATQSEQIRNQCDHKAHSNGEPCIVWEVVGGNLKNKPNAYDTAPVKNTARRFPSVLAASKALGCSQGNLSHVLNGTQRTISGTDGTRYAGKWDPDLADLEGEEWKEKELSTRNQLLVSNYGRLQYTYPCGRKGTKYFPESSNHKGYLVVSIDRKIKYVHVLVGELFFIGPKPLNWAEWDHKDLDKQNNHILNIHPVTREANRINTARQRDFVLWPKDDPDQWVRCVSQARAARDYGFAEQGLNIVLHKRPNKHGSVCKTVNGYCAAWCDEVDGE